jgi:peptidoglycan hydrolase-like protein with peptidoglycan-binding domain
LETGEVPLPVLQYGASGRDVQALQLLLVRAGYPLAVNGSDGVFGVETRARLSPSSRPWAWTPPAPPPP